MSPQKAFLSPDALIATAVAHHKARRLVDAENAYNQALVQDPRNGQALRLLGGLYGQMGKLDQAVALLQKAAAILPDNPEIYNNIGKTFDLQGKPEQAVAYYEKAIGLRPTYVEALLNLGNALPLTGKAAEAEQVLLKALTLSPDNATIWVILGEALRLQGKTEEAEARYSGALRLQPDHIGGIMNMGFMRQMQNRPAEALEFYDQAIKIAPDYDLALANKGITLLALGRYSEGWALCEHGLGKANMRGKNPFQTPVWDGKPIFGKKLLIWCEQGYGDSLQFIRYAALCKARVGKLIVVCPTALVRLFKNLPWVDEVHTGVIPGSYDEHIAMLSLPNVFATTLETIPATMPYLSVPRQITKKWAKRFETIKGFKVGLVWAGNARDPKSESYLIDQRRSMKLAQMAPLLDIENVTFVNLQMGKDAQQIDELGLRSRFLDPMNEVDDFLDTAAIVQNLDLVIAVDTSIVHLAGGLGKPVWILSRFDACWRWLQNRESSPWYPTARIFGQPAPGDWAAVIAKVQDALQTIAVSTSQKQSETEKKWWQFFQKRTKEQ